jgi:8-amino-7-oxononanoate synthase
LADLAQERNAWLMMDDAHGLGVMGNTGAGSSEVLGLDQSRLPILMGTLGKALGTAGAFVAGSDELIEWLLQKARTYLFTTAIPPSLAVATLVSLRLLQEESWRRDQLRALVRRFRQGVQSLGLRLLDSASPIQALILGDNRSAMAASEFLLERGYWVAAVRPPTVPMGTARLRITFSALHEESQVDGLCAALADFLQSQKQEAR